jgi:rhamnogalacturonan endolyase
MGRGVAMDIDPRHRGYETWASGPGLAGLWNAKGETISDRKPRSCNFGVWWAGDWLREILDAYRITKWDWKAGAESPQFVARGCTSNNGTKSTPCLCADILGDWREEVIWRTGDNQERRIYTTAIAPDHRLTTLMHDAQHRLSVAWQNVNYNQSTQPGFYLGEGMSAPPRPGSWCRRHLADFWSPGAGGCGNGNCRNQIIGRRRLGGPIRRWSIPFQAP